MLPYLTVCYFLNSIEHEHEQYALIPSHKNQLLKWKSSQSYDPNDCFQVESLKVKVWNLKLRIFSSKSEAPLRLSRKIHYRLFQLQESQQVTRSPRLPFCVFVTRDWVQVLPARARALDVNNGRDPFNQTFRKFRSKTQWIGSVQPEKFRKNGSTFWGGPLFPVGPVGILVEWFAPYTFTVIFAWVTYWSQ